MRYVDCLIMNVGLQEVKGPGMKARFTYKVARNKQLIEPVIKSLDGMIKPSDDYKEFADARQDLLKEFANKDENGDPIVRTKWVGNQQRESFIIPGINDKTNEFNVRMDKLKEENKKAIDEQDEKETKYDEHLETECDDFTPLYVDWNIVPENLPQEAMDGVQFMIKQSEEKPAAKKKRKPAPAK